MNYCGKIWTKSRRLGWKIGHFWIASLIKKKRFVWCNFCHVKRKSLRQNLLNLATEEEASKWRNIINKISPHKCLLLHCSLMIRRAEDIRRELERQKQRDKQWQREDDESWTNFIKAQLSMIQREQQRHMSNWNDSLVSKDYSWVYFCAISLILLFKRRNSFGIILNNFSIGS